MREEEKSKVLKEIIENPIYFLENIVGVTLNQYQKTWIKIIDKYPNALLLTRRIK